MKLNLALLIASFATTLFLSPFHVHAQSEKASDDFVISDELSIDNYYAQRNGRPFWLTEGALNKHAKDMLHTIEYAWENGLNPHAYNYNYIKSLLGNADLDSQEILKLEVFLTDAFVKYVRDLSGMRIKPSDMELEANHWRMPISAQEALEFLKDDLGNLDEFLLSREPQSKAYQLMKDEMRRLVMDEAPADEDFLRFGGLVRPGQGATDIPKLRSRFGLPQPPDEQKYTYDDDLVAAVIRFQSDKGLKPDGIIGQKTIEILNLTRSEKIKRLVVNMERLRWIPTEAPRRFIVVNIPASRLWAVEDGVIKADMSVVVGRKKRKTNSFVTNVHGVRFNPTWTVPPTIKREDILPQLQENPNHLSDKGMEIFQRQGDDFITIDPTSIDWHSITEKDLSRFRMVQSAGDHNPLGRIRILMPNKYDIYLHDTNHPELFERSDRAQSSGCVRMQYPEQVANFVLSSISGWNKEKMIDVLKSEKTKDYYINEKLPVYLVYNTVWVGDNNQIIYGTDIYDYDSKLMQLIEKVDKKSFIKHSDGIIAKFVD